MDRLRRQHKADTQYWGAPRLLQLSARHLIRNIVSLADRGGRWLILRLMPATYLPIDLRQQFVK